jgi:3-deoxy-manno-octulosonate cytidylyltransferase (CMP-KDO synthetase)
MSTGTEKYREVVMSTIGVIPARLQSTRLPRKLLLNATGQPLIQYVWETAAACPALDEVIIATDSEEIATTVREFGGRAELTGEHPSGTDRIADVVRQFCSHADIVVNLQGDEPELDSDIVTTLVDTIKRSGAPMATVATPITSLETVTDSSCVKVVTDINGKALYFSRATIPFCRDSKPEQLLNDGEPSPWLLHVGLYAYRRDFLLRLSELPPSPLEQLEKLEQLRALQSGATISVAIVNHAAAGIDTPEDYAAFVARQQKVLRHAA